MNHAAVCYRSQIYVWEKSLDEERNKEGSLKVDRKEGDQEGPSQEKEVNTFRC
jgi:hypothetical protein